jgi:ATP-dependent helicase HrpB
MAASLDEDSLQKYLPDLLSTRDQVRWDDQQERFVAQRQQCLGALVVKQEALKTIDPERKGAVLCALIRERGLQVLPWTPELKQWCARIELIRPLQGDAGWPNVSEQALLDDLELWLAPYLNEVRHIDDFNRVDLKAALQAQLPWPLPNQLDELVPERFRVPSGSRIAIDYSVQPPVLAVRLQEMFGCVETPSVAGKQVRLLVHLLSPAKRPLQVTQDLAGFWSGSYEQVKKDMKGRYPKHFWPDNPLECAPTARVKHPKKR